MRTLIFTACVTLTLAGCMEPYAKTQAPQRVFRPAVAPEPVQAASEIKVRVNKPKPIHDTALNNEPEGSRDTSKTVPLLKRVDVDPAGPAPVAIQIE